MTKAYILAICLLATSFVGCVDEDGAEIIVDPIIEKPQATIISINPNPANLSVLNETGVTFTGKGESENGYILEYDWGSSIDGFLSSEKSFTTKNLSLGEHTIFFKVLSDELVWSDKATTVLSVINNTIIEDIKPKYPEVPKWDFFSVDDPHLNVIREDGGRDFAIGIANLGNFSHNFTIQTSYSSDEGGIHFNDLFLVTKFMGFNGEQVAGYSDHLSCFNNVLGYCEGVEFSLGSNDVQIIIYTISVPDEHLNATEFDLYAKTSWYNETDIQTGETKTLSFNVTVIDTKQNGQQVEVGDHTESYYAGFLASNGRLFDTNIEHIWDNYEYRMTGVSDSQRHVSTLPASHVGCLGSGNPSDNCDGSKGMIHGFDAGMLGMYVGQTKYVVIPPEEAYGNSGSHDLAGKTLIFSITIVDIEGKEDKSARAIASTEDSTEATMFNDDRATFNFSAANSISESAITKYEWDFSYDSSEGFIVDEESSNPEITRDFNSGIYVVKVRITNEDGEISESSSSDDIDLKINYVYEATRSISSGQHEHPFQVYSLSPIYIKATLEYETSSLHEDDLDLYLYNKTQERNPDEDEGNSHGECNSCVAKNRTHNVDDIEQVNSIELDYYNSTHRTWFDEYNELGDWFIVVDQERGNAEYTIKIEVIF